MQIWTDGEFRGNCEIHQEGLYLRVLAALPKVDEKICRLTAVTQKERFPLGVMLPRGNELLLDKRVTKKSFPAEKYIFLLEKEDTTFHPVASNTCFEMPEWLERGRYQKIGDVYGIEISSSTGQ